MKVLKWIGIILGIIILLVILAVSFVVVKANKMISKSYSVTPETISIPTDSASLKNGEHWVQFCRHCHGDQLEGKKFFENKGLGTVYTPNLTKGKGGIGAEYTDADWVRAIRHGVAKSGKGLFIMPAKEFHNLGEKDLADIIAYVKTVPPVDNERPATKLTLLAKAMIGAGMFGDVYAAAVIDHKDGFDTPPPVGATKEYGEYLIKVIGCRNCHNQNFAGGKSPDPNSPPVPNITMGGNPGKWTTEQFIMTLRTGQTPEGKKLNKEFMPWDGMVKMSDDELTSIFMFLQTQPKVEPKPAKS